MEGADFEDLDHYLQQSFTNSEGDGQWSLVFIVIVFASLPELHQRQSW